MAQSRSDLISGLSELFLLLRMGTAGRLVLWKVEAKKRKRFATLGFAFLAVSASLVLGAILLGLLAGAWQLHASGFSPVASLLLISAGSLVFALVGGLIASRALGRATRAPRLDDLFPF